LPEHPPVIAVTGLAFEARIAKGPGVTVVCGGAVADKTEAGLKRAIAGGARGIISFGTAGGLAPRLAPGDWVVGNAIIAGARRWPADARWTAKLLESLPGAMGAPLASVEAPAAGASGKRALHEATGAVAVDMESRIAARLAHAHGLPFAAFRVIVDPAGRCLPPAALAAMRPDGGVNIGAVLASLAWQPGQIPLLIRLALDARAAKAALLRGRRMLGPGFGFPDFGVPDFLQL
jgi:hopanoid-associated phosphorylase